MELYKKLNNVTGWAMFIIAAVVYTLTLEPTASFWDCGEFISQGYKLEVGHPPGNPIFILAARFMINFVGNDVTKVGINCFLRETTPAKIISCVSSGKPKASASCSLAFFPSLLP